MGQLNPEQRRWLAAVESFRTGKKRGGIKSVCNIIGLSAATIARGRKEIGAHVAGRSIGKRKCRRGRKAITVVYPDLKDVLADMISDDTAGDPMSDSKWVRLSSRNISRRLEKKATR